MSTDKTDILISFIIPAYNAARFLKFTLESVTSQTYENIEIILIDDGPTDNTHEIASNFAIKDDRIRILKQENKGVAVARNRGIECSTGSFIALLDADDIWHPKAVEKMLHCFTISSSNVAVVYAWSLDIDADNILTGGIHLSRSTGYVYPLLICHNFIGNASSTMIRADHLKSVNGYRTEFNIGCEDLDLYLRLAEKFHYDFVPEFLVAYRKFPGSMSSNSAVLNQSHTQVIDKLKAEHPSIKPALLRLSKINFYAYLSHSTVSDKSRHSTFYWIRQALKTDIFISILRLDLIYVIFLRLWFIAIGDKRRDSLNRKGKSILNGLESGTYTSSFRPPPPIYLIVKLKSFLGSVMLRILKRLA